MASYLETQLRKQRHNKAIIDRNNARQLLLKQQPDVDAIESEETSGEDVPLPNRAYWEDDESDGYDPRIRWIQGEHGEYFYDTRTGPQSDSWGETIPPEGFISDREFAGVTTQFAELLNTDEDAVSRELQNAESSLSAAWQSAVQGDSLPSRRTPLAGAIANTHNISNEEAGRRLVTGALVMRSDQVAALAEDGVYTTGYVGEAIRQRERELALMQEAVQEPESQEESDEALRRTVGEEGERWTRAAEERLAEEAQPTPRRRTMPYEKVGVSETVFASLSPWGQASLDSSEVADNNLTLFQSFPDVWLSDAGDAEIPSSYNQAGQIVKVSEKNRRDSEGNLKELKKNKKYAVDLVRAANDAVDAHNRKTINEYLRKRVEEEGGTHQSHAPTVYDVLSGNDYSLLKEAAREDGLPEEVVKERAVLYTFEEWMKRRDTLWEKGVRKARNQQNKNKEKYGAYVSQRAGLFDESGTGVVGTPTTDWIEEYGSFVKDASNSFTKFQSLDIPSSARVWPPEEKGLSPKDGSKFINALQGGRRGNIRELIKSWFNYNVGTLRLRDPVKASNEANWGFAAGQVENATRSIIANRANTSQLISIDNNGAIGAVLNYSDYGYGSWSVSSAGTSPKGFSSWPVDEIAAALGNAINEAGRGMSRVEQLRDPSLKALRIVNRNWEEHGGGLISTTHRGETDRYHAALVFFEFASKFLREGGKSVSTSGISDYVTDHYKRFGFAGGTNANRLNILWTLTTQGGAFLPREKRTDSETGEEIDDVILKSFDTGLNKVAYTEKHDTIKTDNRLDVLQGMLDNLMNKADKRYGFTDKKLAQANEQEIKDLQDNLEMDDEEFEDYLEGMMYMFAGTGHPESSE